MILELEKEIKFSITPAQISVLKSHAAILPFYTKKILLHNTYYDTPDFALRAKKAALRLRTIDHTQPSLEIKFARDDTSKHNFRPVEKSRGARHCEEASCRRSNLVASQKDCFGHPCPRNDGFVPRHPSPLVLFEKNSKKDIQIREEISLPLTSSVLDISQIPPNIKQKLGKLDNLKPLFNTDFEREIWDFFPENKVHIELALDQGEIKSRASKATEKISEIELELKSGTLSDLLQFADWLKSQLCLTLQPLSKAQRGYALI